MQTFLPSPNFVETARVLDRQRLGKQRVENLQIMIALLEKRGWVHHPAVNMWRGFEKALLDYQFQICYEWHVARGYTDTCLNKTIDLYTKYRGEESANSRRQVIMPPWMGDKEFHLSHQSNLLRKIPEYYGPIFPGVPDDIPYVWPV